MVSIMHQIYLGRKSSYLPPASLGFALVRGDDGDPGELVLLLLLLLLLRRHFASSEQRQGSSLGVVCNMNQGGDPGYRARGGGLEGSIQVKLLPEFRRNGQLANGSQLFKVQPNFMADFLPTNSCGRAIPKAKSWS